MSALVSLAALVLAGAQDSTDAHELWRRVRVQLETAKTLVGTGTLVKTTGDEKTVSTMTFKYERPNKYLYVQNVRGHGDFMWVGNGVSDIAYDASKNSYTKWTSEDKTFAFILPVPLDRFLSNRKFANEYEVHSKTVVKTTFDGKPTLQIELRQIIPNMAQDRLPKILVYVDPVTSLPVGATKVYAPNPDRTPPLPTFEMTYDVKLNETIPSKTFEFQVPEGATLDDTDDYEAKLLAPGTKAPDFDVPTHLGASASLESLLKGQKLLLLNFWFYG
jgi:outer membrane lipoprotein-sorting protein